MKERIKNPDAAVDKNKKKSILKRIILIVLVSLAALVALYFILGALSPDENIHKTKQKDEVYETFTPFAADWDKNVYEDEQYRTLSTDVFYGYDELGGNLLTLDFISGQEHEGHRFFETYFDILKKGDYAAYSELFHKDYAEEDSFEKNTGRSFPPQMVYDIVVRELGRFEDDKKNISGVYLVEYKIHKNDCLFRNDIGYSAEINSYITRPLVFELSTENAGEKDEKTLITNIYTTSSIAE